jgi:hypothetical protein
MKVVMASPRPRRAVGLWLAGWLVVAPAAGLAQAQGTGVPASLAQAPEGRVIDEVVAVIEGQVLTRSELEFETRVEFIQRGAVQAAFEPLDEETLRAGLEQAINVRLQVLSADRLEALPAELEEVEARLARFRDRFEREQAFRGFLARWGADVKLLTEVLGRQVRAGRILDSRIRPRLEVVSDTDAQRYYQQHASEFPEGFPAVKLLIQNKLKKEQYDRLAVEDVNQLRASAQVRRVAPFAREARR